MLRIPDLEVFLDAKITPGFLGRFPGSIEAVAGWGYKPTSLQARKYADRHKFPYLAIEDGFLRSVGLGDRTPPLSVVIDDLGIYYDASRPSRLEAQIPQSRSDEELHRAQQLITSWRNARVSKYNHLREYAGELPDNYVLVVDQTWGDASITLGQANADSFQRMLQAALAENPDSTVLVKIHPDVFAGKKRGYFDVPALSAMPRVHVLSEDVHPVRLIESARSVYAVTSQMGFEGLLWDKPVRTFGMPFYAGWGLSVDEQPAPPCRSNVSIEQLAYAALITYPRYADPETHERCEAEVILAHISLQREKRNRYPETVYAPGFSIYKKPIVRDFLQGSEVRFVPRADSVPDGSTLIVWGRNGNHTNPAIRTVHLEDGFIRSVGLGADLIRPVSWIMDERGIYFDSRRPSDLELIFQTTTFNESLLSRSKNLRELIVAAGLTKYNVGTSGWKRPAHAVKVILVPGQVETDASITFGSPVIQRNMDLLRSVREQNPDAYVIYKPHPDVLAGLRAEGQGENSASKWCNEIVTGAAMGDLLQLVDEVHVLTSLAGFEALLRGKSVTCYGQPFYAGWGLTTDMAPIPRRSRSLSIDELLAGALILHPVYLSRNSGRFTTPERALDELLNLKKSNNTGLRWWSGIYRLFVRTFIPRR